METVISASARATIAQELLRDSLSMHNAEPELDPTKNRELMAEFSQCVSTDDIMLALEKRVTGLKDFRNDRWAKLRQKLKPVVEVTLQVTKIVGDSAQSIGIPGDKGLFAAFGLLLTATQAQSERYDALGKLLDQLGAFLLRFNVLYERTSSQARLGLDQIATSILAHLFYVLALTTKFLRKGRISHYIHTLLRFPDDLKEALQRMDDLTKEEYMMMAAQTLVAVEQLGPTVEHTDKNVEDLKKDFQKVQRIQVDENLRKWLAAPDSATDRNSALAKRQAGTGDWFLHTEIFKRWKVFGGNLWLHGQSGSGKTVVSACIVDQLLHDIDTPDLAYFFFVTKSGTKETIEDMLSSILIQLATREERYKILCDAYELDKHIGLPSRSALLTYFDRMLRVPGDVTLVIDALDEHPTPRDELLRFLGDLSRDHHDYLHLLVTSRNEFDIRTAMKGMGVIEIDLSEASEQKKDIHKYITSVLESDEPFRTWTISYPRILGLIRKRLLQEHMFRLVALQLDRLRRTTPIDVEQTLSTLPRSLMQMYDHILQSLASENPSVSRRVMHVFEIISCALRPLTVNEVAEVFAIEFGDNNHARVLEEYRLQDPAAELLRMCTSTFIRIEEGWRSRVGFAHASVLDFLQRKQDAGTVSDFRIDDANSAITITKLCLCTVISMIQPSNLHQTRGPFDYYAHQFWLEETARALLLKSVDEIRPLLDSILLQDIEGIPAHDRDSYSKFSSASPLCCACYLGRRDYVQRILHSNPRAVGTKCSNKWTPLHCATSRGHIGVAKLLIEHSAPVNEKDENGWTPLHVASQHGHPEIAQFLIEYGASVDEANSQCRTPLHLALQGDHLGIAHLLIKHTASVDIVDENGWTPLHLASERGHLNITQALIEHSASVNKRDKAGRTPLHLASQRRHLDIVRVLIKHRASVDKEDKDGWTPLHFASQKGQPGVAQFLIEHGASVDKANNYRRTPLHLAVQGDHLRNAQLLIEHSASVDKEDQDGLTPLHIASESGQLNIARVLIEHSTSVDKEDEDGWTPLHFSSHGGHLVITQLLLERGASVDKENMYGQTPLDLASENGHIGTAMLLMERSASIDKVH